MDFMSAPSQEFGVLPSPLLLSAEGDCGKTRNLGEGAAAGLHWGAGKGGEVQSRLTHTRLLLALLVQSQTRRGTMSKQYQVGPERRDTESERGQKGRDAM